MLTELNETLSDSTEAATRDRINLRDAVCSYIAAEQARGTPLGKIVQSVKEILRKAERVTISPTDATQAREDDLAQKLVDWCAESQRAAGA